MRLSKVEADELDYLLSEGWRHFGANFFRYNLGIHNEKLCQVFSLRLRLDNYKHSKRFQRILRKNSRFRTEIEPLNITEEKVRLFEHHKYKFAENIPESIYTFVSPVPNVPLPTKEVNVYDGDKLIASSFVDVANESASSIYGMFDLNYKANSLGLYTMLLEIEYAISQGKKFYYHGYCYDVESFYDYKKKFSALEWFDWKGNWKTYEGSFPPIENNFL